MFDHLYCVFSEAGFTIFGKNRAECDSADKRWGLEDELWR